MGREKVLYCKQPFVGQIRPTKGIFGQLSNFGVLSEAFQYGRFRRWIVVVDSVREQRDKKIGAACCPGDGADSGGPPAAKAFYAGACRSSSNCHSRSSTKGAGISDNRAASEREC